MKIYYARSAGTVSGPISNSFFQALTYALGTRKSQAFFFLKQCEE